MVFNSLYHSIIQEYNIGFETVIRPAIQSFIIHNFKKDNKKNKGKNKKDKNENNKDNINKEGKSDNDYNIKEEEFIENEDEHEYVEINDIVKKMKNAILPLILEGSVSNRNILKKIQKKKKHPFVYEISLYGFLDIKIVDFM